MKFFIAEIIIKHNMNGCGSLYFLPFVLFMHGSHAKQILYYPQLSSAHIRHSD
jgi:hypothetical protein